MNRHSQQGAALITGLIILVVMSLVGISTMETAVLQTNLASNAQLKAITYQETEAALQRGSTLNYMQLAMQRDPTDDQTSFTYTDALDALGNPPPVVNATATTSYCGTLASQDTRGQSMDANQATNSGAYTHHVFDITATAQLAVGGQARSQHTQRSWRLMLAAGGATVC
jgi:type IV pilus assembly protein PilX